MGWTMPEEGSHTAARGAVCCRLRRRGCRPVVLPPLPPQPWSACWASSGCQLWKLRSICFTWKGTWSAESRGVLLSAASEIEPGSGPHWFAGLSQVGVITLIYSYSSLCPSVFPWFSLLCPPVLMMGHHYQPPNLHAPDLPPRESNLFPQGSQCPSLDQSMVSRAGCTIARASATALQMG